MGKKRLDEILVEKELVKNKQGAFIVVTEGRVFVNGQKAVSPAQPVGVDAKIEIRGEKKFVGRGAIKLAAALEKFRIEVGGKICADIGAATGGFTEILLRQGAKKVYAIDTARGKLALKLRNDFRVVVMEETDIRHLGTLPDSVDLITIDVSLLPLEQILPHAARFLKAGGEVVALFKPQYQTRDQKILQRGIVKDKNARERLLENFRQWAEKHGWEILGETESPIKGSEGNAEYLLHLESESRN